MGKDCSTNGEIQKRVQNFKQNTRKEETTMHSYKKKQQSYYSVYFFFFSSTTLYEFWLAQLFSSIVSSLAPSVSSSSLPSFSGHFSRRLPILILAFLSVLLRTVITVYTH
jgi:hypothetical protein